jgi:hypothetical protein
MWKKQYSPRNHVPWAIMTICTFVSGILILVLRFMLAAENKRRDAEPYDDTYDDAHIVVVDADGTSTKKMVDKVSSFWLQPRLAGTYYVAVISRLDGQAEPRVPICALIGRVLDICYNVKLPEI